MTVASAPSVRIWLRVQGLGILVVAWEVASQAMVAYGGWDGKVAGVWRLGREGGGGIVVGAVSASHGGGRGLQWQSRTAGRRRGSGILGTLGGDRRFMIQ